jgi:hypothetical protein
MVIIVTTKYILQNSLNFISPTINLMPSEISKGGNYTYTSIREWNETMCIIGSIYWTPLR